MSVMRQPCFFLCHGGGPWPWLQGPLRQMLGGLEQGLRALPQLLPERPAAILVVSSHWESPVFSVSTSPAPGMVYDYSGFPPETYQIRYPAPGHPALAREVLALLDASGLAAQGDESRGYDHSSYSLLQPIFPAADIPLLQLSLQESLDPALHLRAGAALAPLRDRGVLIIGSGMSCHERGPAMREASPAFDDWLHKAVLSSSAQQRHQALCDWGRAPFARVVHPREDHLLPLMVAAGAAGDDPAQCIYRERLMGIVAVSSFKFGS